MKRIIKLSIIAVIAVILTLAVTGCNSSAKNVRIKSVMTLSSTFSGDRVMTCLFPNKLISTDEKEKNLESTVKSFIPDSMTYTKEIVDEGIQYTFTIKFTSKAEYEAAVKTVLNREPSIMFVTSNTILAKGWRFIEDFDTAELLKWIPDGFESKGIDNIVLNSEVESCMVNMDGKLEKSPSTININKMEGYAVKGVSIETTNYKNYTYDRKIKLSFPQSTFDKISSELKAYIEDRTAPGAEYATWTKEGNYQCYEVLYKAITIYQLIENTNLLFDSIDGTAEYGDTTNSSTALAEQLTFREKLNLLCYVGENGKNPEINYNYTVVGNTTYGEGSVYKQGEWKSYGKWKDGIYSMTTDDSSVNISIPDGTQYEIEALYITLESHGDDKFVRTMDFIYDADTGNKGLDYAYSYFKARGVDVEKLKSDPYMVCRVIHEGSSKKLSAKLGNLFGGGNYVSYSATEDTLSIINTTNYTENINISYMLTGKNASVPLVYTVWEKGSESVRSLDATGDNYKEEGKQKENNRNQISVNLKSGDSSISFTGVIPNGFGIFIYCLISFMMIAAAIFLISVRTAKYKALKAKAAAAMANKKENAANNKKEPSIEAKKEQAISAGKNKKQSAIMPRRNDRNVKKQ